MSAAPDSAGPSPSLSTARRPRLRLFLRQRLLLLAAVALLPGLVVLGYNEVGLRQSRQAEAHETALRNGQQAAAEMQRIFEGIRNLLIAISGNDDVIELNQPACNAYLHSVAARMPSLGGIVVFDPNGSVRCDSGSAVSAPDLAKSPDFAESAKHEGLVIGEYYKDPSTGLAELPVAVALTDGSGAAKGMIQTGLRLDWLQARVKDRGLAGGGSLTIADRNGVIVAREPLPERFIGTRIPDAFQAQVHAAEPGTIDVKSQDGTERILGYIPVGAEPFGIYVSAGISKDEAFRPIDEAPKSSVALIAAGAVLALGLAWFVARSFITRPVERLLKTIALWRQGDASARTGMVAGEGELETVGAEFDNLLGELSLRAALRQQAEEQRDLVMREMGHRMKNMLAVVQVFAGQSFRRAGDARAGETAFNERVAALATAYDILLAKNWEAADIRDVIIATIKPYRQNDELRFTISGPSLTLPSTTVLAVSMIVHELCTNAIKYGALSREGGRVRISWDLQTAEVQHRCRLEWAEEGGPPVVATAKAGFGSRLIERALPANLNPSVEISRLPAGIVCRVEFDLSEAEPVIVT